MVYFSGASLPRLSHKKGHYADVVVVVVVYVMISSAIVTMLSYLFINIMISVPMAGHNN